MPHEDRRRLLVNLGSGSRGHTRLPSLFDDWHEVRVDLDPRTMPDLLADITDLSAIETGSVDAVWSAHCLEHLYLHQVSQAIAEAYRILAGDGFYCLIVPDLQAIAEFIATDRLHEVIYEAPAGPVTAHDMIYGFGRFLAEGRTAMAHRSGFTPTLLLHKLQEVPFAEIILRRLANHELAAVGCKRPSAGEAEREAFLAVLGL